VQKISGENVFQNTERTAQSVLSLQNVGPVRCPPCDRRPWLLFEYETVKVYIVASSHLPAKSAGDCDGK